jgi:protein phosphatase
VKDEQIQSIMAAHQGDTKMCASKLIEAANENGGPDNITAVVVRWTQ